MDDWAFDTVVDAGGKRFPGWGSTKTLCRRPSAPYNSCSRQSMPQSLLVRSASRSDSDACGSLLSALLTPRCVPAQLVASVFPPRRRSRAARARLGRGPPRRRPVHGCASSGTPRRWQVGSVPRPRCGAGGRRAPAAGARGPAAATRRRRPLGRRSWGPCLRAIRAAAPAHGGRRMVVAT